MNTHNETINQHAKELSAKEVKDALYAIRSKHQKALAVLLDARHNAEEAAGIPEGEYIPSHEVPGFLMGGVLDDLASDYNLILDLHDYEENESFWALIDSHIRGLDGDIANSIQQRIENWDDFAELAAKKSLWQKFCSLFKRQ